MPRASERIPVKAQLYRHQADAFHFVMKLFKPSSSAGAALLMEMGTGKTITSIAVTGAMHQSGKVRRVLIVAPLSILGVWNEEFKKFAAFPYSLSILSGSVRKKTDTLQKMCGDILQIVVVNYESAWRMEKELAAWKPDLIICDEGHKIKTHNISASKTMHRLGAKARYKLLLTGTVITNKAIDVFSQYKFMNPAVFGQSFYSFRNRYFDMVGYGNHPGHEAFDGTGIYPKSAQCSVPCHQSGMSRPAGDH